MNDKKIVCIRGGKANPMILSNGDQYDSRMLLYKSETGQAPYYFIDGFENCNTDPSLQFLDKKTWIMQAGILKEKLYAFICIDSKKLGKCLWLFDSDHFVDVNKMIDIKEEYQTLESIIPNPNQGGKKIIKQVAIHKGGASEWDWSQACQTIYGPDYQRFIDNFTIGEKGYYELVRAEFWTPPAWY